MREDSAHARNHDLSAAAEIFANGTYFPNTPVQRCGEPMVVACGDRLGDMSDELGSDVHIEEFVSGGSTNYAYRTVNCSTEESKTVCKVRGITLNYTSSELINFDLSET
jgi:hypothetical protein